MHETFKLISVPTQTKIHAFTSKNDPNEDAFCRERMSNYQRRRHWNNSLQSLIALLLLYFTAIICDNMERRRNIVVAGERSHIRAAFVKDESSSASARQLLLLKKRVWTWNQFKDTLALRVFIFPSPPTTTGGPIIVLH